MVKINVEKGNKLSLKRTPRFNSKALNLWVQFHCCISGCILMGIHHHLMFSFCRPVEKDMLHSESPRFTEIPRRARLRAFSCTHAQVHTRTSAHAPSTRVPSPAFLLHSALMPAAETWASARHTPPWALPEGEVVTLTKFVTFYFSFPCCWDDGLFQE